MTRARPAVVLLGLGSVLALSSVSLTSDPDTFWHLAVAREALRTGSWLPSDVFSFSFAGAPWLYKDLAGAVTLYAGFPALGFAWLAALKALCGAAMLASMHAAPRPEQRSPAVTLVAGGLLLSSFWLVERPNLFSMAFFSVVLVLIEHARRQALAPGQAAAWGRGGLAVTLGALVAVTWLWTWVHRFALLGHALVALLALDLAIAGVVRRRTSAEDRVPASRVVLVALAAVAGPTLGLLNPSGAHAYTSGFAMAEHPELRAALMEWKRPTLGEMWSVFPVALLLASGAIVWAAGRLAQGATPRAPVRPAHVVLLLALAGLTFDSFRWVPYLAIASAFVLARLLGGHARVRAAPAWSLLLCATAAVAWVRHRSESPFAVGEDPAFVPAGALAFARENGLRGRVANAFDFGGYLMWHMAHDVQVLVDGRNELVYPAAFTVRALRAEHDPATFAAMRAEDGATWALGVNFPERQPGFGFLADDPAWSLVFWSETSAIYAHRADHPELEALRFRYIDPFDPSGSVAAAVERAAGDPGTLAAVEREIARMLDASPESARAAFCLAVFYHLQGPSHWAARDQALDVFVRDGQGDERYLELAKRLRASPPFAGGP